MSDVLFVDTTLLVYARDSSEAKKQPRAADWMQRLWQERSGRLSWQVLQEYYVTVTQKLRPGLPVADARHDVRLLSAWQPLSADGPMVDSAWQIETRYRLSFWDALIVSAAQRAGARYLLSEDLQDGLAIGELQVVNPFKHAPDSL